MLRSAGICQVRLRSADSCNKNMPSFQTGKAKGPIALTHLCASAHVCTCVDLVSHNHATAQNKSALEKKPASGRSVSTRIDPRHACVRSFCACPNQWLPSKYDVAYIGELAVITADVPCKSIHEVLLLFMSTKQGISKAQRLECSFSLRFPQPAAGPCLPETRATLHILFPMARTKQDLMPS